MQLLPHRRTIGTAHLDVVLSRTRESVCPVCVRHRRRTLTLGSVPLVRRVATQPLAKVNVTIWLLELHCMIRGQNTAKTTRERHLAGSRVL
jgi:hypothetical protein